MNKLSIYITISVLLITVVTVVTTTSSASVLKQDQFLENGAGKFVIEIPGLPAASANIHSVQIEDLTIDVRETTTDENWDFRQYAPGDAHFGKARLTFRFNEKSHKEILQWVQDASIGKNVRKNISIIVLDRAGKEGRRYTAKESFSLQFDPGDYSPSSTTRMETVVVKIGRWIIDNNDDKGEEKATAYGGGALQPDKMNVTKGFRIEVSGPSGGVQEDSSWETMTGGALNIKAAPASTGLNQFSVTTPGHKFVEEIQLRGPMTAGRKWLLECLNNSLAGKVTPIEMNFIEILPGKQTGREQPYSNCIVTRYVFPILSADGTGNLYEEVSIKPEKLEVK